MDRAHNQDPHWIQKEHFTSNTKRIFPDRESIDQFCVAIAGLSEHGQGLSIGGIQAGDPMDAVEEFLKLPTHKHHMVNIGVGGVLQIRFESAPYNERMTRRPALSWDIWQPLGKDNPGEIHPIIEKAAQDYTVRAPLRMRWNPFRGYPVVVSLRRRDVADKQWQSKVQRRASIFGALGGALTGGILTGIIEIVSASNGS